MKTPRWFKVEYQTIAFGLSCWAGKRTELVNSECIKCAVNTIKDKAKQRGLRVLPGIKVIELPNVHLGYTPRVNRNLMQQKK